ncbi:MAG: polysaccharide biosynthesis tyrosine autokinase [Hyphomonadaceae bacterium]|nr:polysaccharide biosynthesis tyrosine autokinase [Hyphomonadaceae bacterium]
MGPAPDFAGLKSEEREVTQNAVSFQDILLSLRQWRLLILAFVLFGAGAAVAMHFLSPVQYTASSTVVLLARPDRLVESDQGASPVDDAAIQSEIAIIKSAAVAGLVVDKQQLASDPDWNGAPRRSPFDLSVFQPKAPAAEQRPAPERREIAVRTLNWATAARRVETSYAIDVRVSAPTPAGAASLTNGLVEAYLEWHRNVDGDRARVAGDWLDTRLTDLRKEVEEKENLLEVYRADRGLISAEGSTVSEQQLASAQTAVSEARSKFAESTAKLKQIEDLRGSGGSVDTSAAALDSQVIQMLRVQEAELLRRIAQLKATYFDTHPDVQKAEAEYQDTRAAIDAELGRILVSIRSEVAVAENRLTSSNAALAQAQRQLGVNNEGVVRLRELERDAAASRKSYEEYRSQSRQTTDRESLPAVVARQVSPATKPVTSDRPPVILMVVFGAMCGLFFSFGLVFLRHLMDDKLHGASDATRKVGRRALVSIPYLRAGGMRSLAPAERHPAGYLVSKPMSAYAETYRVLRKSVIPGETARRNIVVAVTSALPDEGKTTAAWSLARAAALAGQRVIIVDCDLRRRSLSGYLRPKPEAGLSRVVADPQTLPSVIVLDTETSASIIPSVAEDLAVDDLLGSEKMAQLVESLRRSYDFVVLDCPPVLAVADAIAAAALADSTVVVARADKTPAKAIRSAVSQLESAGGFVVGLALNCVQPKVVGRYSFDDSLYLQHAKNRYYVG